MVGFIGGLWGSLRGLRGSPEGFGGLTVVCRAPRLGFGGLQWSLGSTSGLRGSQKCFGGPLVFSVGVSERLWGSPKGCRGLSVVFGGLQWSLGVSNGLWASLGVSSGLWGSPVIFDALQWSLELSNVLWGSPKSFAGPAVTFWGLQMIFGIQPPPPIPLPSVCRQQPRPDLDGDPVPWDDLHPTRFHPVGVLQGLGFGRPRRPRRLRRRHRHR